MTTYPDNQAITNMVKIKPLFSGWGLVNQDKLSW